MQKIFYQLTMVSYSEWFLIVGIAAMLAAAMITLIIVLAGRRKRKHLSSLMDKEYGPEVKL